MITLQKKQALVSSAINHQIDYNRDYTLDDDRTHKAERAQIKYTDEQLKIADKLLENSTLELEKQDDYK